MKKERGYGSFALTMNSIHSWEISVEETYSSKSTPESGSEVKPGWGKISEWYFCYFWPEIPWKNV